MEVQTWSGFVPVAGLCTADDLAKSTNPLHFDAVPVVPPGNFLDGPEDGWPWQLEHCWVIKTQGVGHAMLFNVKCKLCGWHLKSCITIHRIGLQLAVSLVSQVTPVESELSARAGPHLD